MNHIDKLNKRIRECFKLQDTFNKKVDPKYKTAQYKWYRAAWIEGGEATGWMPWKWWKGGETLKEKQFLIEIVDIFHFSLSQELTRIDVNRLSDFDYATLFENLQKKYKKKDDQIDAVENFVVSTIQNRSAGMYYFAKLIIELGIDLNTIIDYYFIKNCLNTFRQDNGDKAGTYPRLWSKDGSYENLEDNEVMEKIVHKLERNSIVISFDLLYNELVEEFKTITRK